MISDDYRAGFRQGWKAGAQAQLDRNLALFRDLPETLMGNKQAEGRVFRPTDIELVRAGMKAALSVLGTVPPPGKVK